MVLGAASTSGSFHTSVCSLLLQIQQDILLSYRWNVSAVGTKTVWTRSRFCIVEYICSLLVVWHVVIFCNRSCFWPLPRTSAWKWSTGISWRETFWDAQYGPVKQYRWLYINHAQVWTMLISSLLFLQKQRSLPISLPQVIQFQILFQAFGPVLVHSLIWNETTYFGGS